MEYQDLFLSHERTHRQSEYLIYSYETLDDELFSSFKINPLREIGLNISSMFYANLCLRLYPLLTIGFQVHTFHYEYQDYIDRLYLAEKEKRSWLHVDLDKIMGLFKDLREKNRNNEDNIRDYYKFYRKIPSAFWQFFNLDDVRKPINHVGLIEYDEEVQPFQKKNWNKFLEVRNGIEHRGYTEATLSNVIIGFSSLFLLLRGLCYAQYGVDFGFSSNIFGDVGRSIYK